MRIILIYIAGNVNTKNHGDCAAVAPTNKKTPAALEI